MKMMREERDPTQHSATKTEKPVNFYLSAPEARSVQLEGDFTGWIPLVMQRREDGWWFLQLPLAHGHHRYRFLVDGQIRLDPRAAGVARKEDNEEVSLVAVS